MTKDDKNDAKQKLKEAKPKKNIHEGHRARLLQLVTNCGLENCSEVQAMEFFLTYIFPRGDTNPLAHRLLDEYQSFTCVLEANPDDLIRIEGINKRSAALISAFKELFFYFYSCRMGKKIRVSNLPELIDIVEDNLRFRTTEYGLLIGLSPTDYIIRKQIFSNQNASEVGIDTGALTAFIANVHPTSLVVAHCHPYGKAFESTKDVEAFKRINEICATMGVKLLDSFIVGEDGTFSQMNESYVRGVHDVEELAEKFKKLLAE